MGGGSPPCGKSVPPEENCHNRNQVLVFAADAELEPRLRREAQLLARRRERAERVPEDLVRAVREAASTATNRSVPTTSRAFSSDGASAAATEQIVINPAALEIRANSAINSGFCWSASTFTRHPRSNSLRSAA